MFDGFYHINNQESFHVFGVFYVKTSQWEVHLQHLHLPTQESPAVWLAWAVISRMQTAIGTTLHDEPFLEKKQKGWGNYLGLKGQYLVITQSGKKKYIYIYTHQLYTRNCFSYILYNTPPSREGIYLICYTYQSHYSSPLNS